MIYQLSTIEVAPGKTTEYGEILSKEMMPIYAKLGLKMAASWHGYTGNVNEQYSLLVFDNIAAYEKTRAKVRDDKEYQRVSAKLNTLRTKVTYTILEPNAWSPMK